MEEDSAVQDFLDILEEHRKNCENEGKYVEAEIAKNRLEELKLHEGRGCTVEMPPLSHHHRLTKLTLREVSAPTMKRVHESIDPS